jgi:hypothetical protein
MENVQEYREKNDRESTKRRYDTGSKAMQAIETTPTDSISDTIGPFAYGGVGSQKRVQETNQKYYKKYDYYNGFGLKDETVLEEAERLTNSKRKDEYGTYAENAEKAVKIYAAMRGSSIVETAADVALFQLAHKLGREMCRHKRDNVVDACGYLKLYYEEVTRDTNKENF